MSFLEMPNFFNDEEWDETEDLPAQPRTRTENLTAIRTRDLKTGRFVGAPSLVTKGWKDIFRSGAEARTEGRNLRKKKWETDDKMSVTLKKIKEKR